MLQHQLVPVHGITVQHALQIIGAMVMVSVLHPGAIVRIHVCARARAARRHDGLVFSVQGEHTL